MTILAARAADHQAAIGSQIEEQAWATFAACRHRHAAGSGTDVQILLQDGNVIFTREQLFLGKLFAIAKFAFATIIPPVLEDHWQTLTKPMQTSTRRSASQALRQDGVTASWGEEVQHWHRLAQLGLLPMGMGNAVLVDLQRAAKEPCNERSASVKAWRDVVDPVVVG